MSKLSKVSLVLVNHNVLDGLDSCVQVAEMKSKHQHSETWKFMTVCVARIQVVKNLKVLENNNKVWK